MDTIHTFLLVPTGPGVGLTSVSVGLVRALDRVGLRVRFLKPIGQQHETDTGPERSTGMLRQTMPLDPPEPIQIHRAELLISNNNEDDLMEEVVALYQQTADGADVVVVEGLVPTLNQAYADQLNALLARALDAEVILVSTLNRGTVAELDERIELTARFFGGLGDPKLLGGIINKLNVPPSANLPLGGMSPPIEKSESEALHTAVDEIKLIQEQAQSFKRPDFRLLGLIPWHQRLVAPRTRDIANHLQATIFNEGEIDQRRVNRFAVCASNIPNMAHVLQPGVLVITPGDRADVIVTASLAAINKIPLAGILVTGGLRPDPRVLELCYAALDTGLPALSVDTDSYHTAALLQNINTEVPLDDKQRIEWVMDSIARRIDAHWLKERCSTNRELRLSPPAFRHLISERARQANKRIVLPEGNEPRTIQAAAICHERGIAHCVLLGKASEIRRVARAQGVDWPPDIEIIDPDEVRHKYVAPLVERRKHKGLSAPMALAQLEDNVVLGTMMLYLGEVDGLVSGAVHTTANTIRPALQLIKTKPGTRLVSSIFFMLLPEQVLVYGDCAINP
ncbi:MAG: phosphate acetyltransferase, partial [Anaerolineales bacterium]|nr:phosphate acetyltransferase [Anaerolineales bacterium]